MGVTLGPEGVIRYRNSIFGEIDADLVESVTVKDLQKLLDAIKEITGSAPRSGGRYDGMNEDYYMQFVDDLRTSLGALYIQTSRQLLKDIEDGQRASSHFFGCMMNALRGKLLPNKYRDLCGTNVSFYYSAAHVLMYPRMQDVLPQKWGFSRYSEFQHKLRTTTDRLMQLEQEYRDISVANLQIGVGVGGMLIGFASLLLGVVLRFI